MDGSKAAPHLSFVTVQVTTYHMDDREYNGSWGTLTRYKLQMARICKAKGGTIDMSSLEVEKINAFQTHPYSIFHISTSALSFESWGF